MPSRYQQQRQEFGAAETQASDTETIYRSQMQAVDAQLEQQVQQLKAVVAVSLVALAVLLYRQPQQSS